MAMMPGMGPPAPTGPTMVGPKPVRDFGFDGSTLAGIMSQQQPARHWTGAAGNLASALAGSVQARRDQKQEAESEQARTDALVQVLASKGVPASQAQAIVTSGSSEALTQALAGPEPVEETGPDYTTPRAFYNHDTGETRTVNTRAGETDAIQAGFTTEAPPEAPEPVAPAATDWEFRDIGGVPHRVDLATGTAEPLTTGGQPFEAPAPSTPEETGLNLNETQGKAYEAAVIIDGSLDILGTPTESGERLFDLGTQVAAPNSALRGEDRQRFDQSMDEIANAILRLETGAQAPEHEVAGVIKRYSPKFGDREGTVQQKWERLQVRYQTALDRSGLAPQQIERLGIGQGRAAQPAPGAPAAGPDLSNIGGMSMQQLESMAADPSLSNEQLQQLAAEWDRRNG